MCTMVRNTCFLDPKDTVLLKQLPNTLNVRKYLGLHKLIYYKSSRTLFLDRIICTKHQIDWVKCLSKTVPRCGESLHDP